MNGIATGTNISGQSEPAIKYNREIHHTPTGFPKL